MYPKVFIQPVGRRKALQLPIRREKSSSTNNKEAASFWKEFLQDFCKNSSFHGLHNLARDDRHICEKILWAGLILAAITAGYLSSLSIWTLYSTASTITVVETTRYEWSNVAFPSVTICDASRVDWKKALQLTYKDLPEESFVSMDNVRVLLKALAGMSFGDFDFIGYVTQANISPVEFKDINISELLRKVQRSCLDMFESCWWRDKFYDCCSLFELQISDFGFCYSFNSDLSEISRHHSKTYGVHGGHDYWIDWMGDLRPRRTGGHGPWTGLRVIVNVLSEDQIPPGTNITPGIHIYVNGPREFPGGDTFSVAPRTQADVRLSGNALRTQGRVRSLDPKLRNCLFLDERPHSLNGVYQEQNCNAECLKNYTLQYCGCVPDFLLIHDDVPEDPACNVSGLICLADNNLVFNFLVPRAAPEFFRSNVSGMYCDCLPDCVSQEYIAELATSQSPELTKQIILDLHYRLQYSTLYKSDVEYGGIELIGTGMFRAVLMSRCRAAVQLVVRRKISEYDAEKIGNREFVGPGMNNQYSYIDDVAFPFPSIRFRVVDPYMKALREKEKGDWRSLSLVEKKCLYRASFCQTFAEMQAPTGLWKMIIGWTCFYVSLGIWLFILIKVYVYPPLPSSFTTESKEAQERRMINLRMNPIQGISSKWDYEKNEWKK